MGYEISLSKYIYSTTRVQSTMSSAQFRKVGLDFELGIKPLKGIQVFLGHTSEHTLDMSGYREFPQRNAIGIRFNYIDKGE